MAKRFTDSEKWQDDWFFNLDQCGKLSWLYIIDHCDHAGFWKKNIKLLNFNTGCNYVEDELLQIFNSRIIKIEDKWFIPKFITFQYGNKFATSKQKPVQSAIEILRKFNLIQEDTNGNITLSLPNGNPNLTLPIGLPNPNVTLMDMDMDKKMEMDTNMDKKTELDKELEKDKKMKLIYERMNIFSKIKSKGYDSLTQQEKDRFEELEKIK
jgi:hypothetical protein